MTIAKGGNRYFFCTPIYVLDTITPYAGVKTADLASPNGTTTNYINLSNFRGMSIVPEQATAIKIWDHLFRGIASPISSSDTTGGNLDVTMSLSLPTVNGETLINLATLAVTTQGASPNSPTPPVYAAQPFPPSSIIETIGIEGEFPNIVETNGNYARCGWSMGGNTVLGSAAMTRITSFEVPSDYTLPSIWPARNVTGSSLAMYFGTDGFADSSPANRTVTEHNCSIQPGSTTDWATTGSPLFVDMGGGAVFDGSTSYLTFDGHDIVLSGDFTIELTMSGSTNTMNGGTQQRILSLGGPGSPAIGIDQVGGGAILLNEQTAILHTGGNSIISTFPTHLKWAREGNTNTFTVNGQRDGQSFIDTTSWIISSAASIGRFIGSNAGYFNGKILFLKIHNGKAI